MRKQLAFDGMGVNLDERVEASTELLRELEPDGEYYGCFSGGKDSVVIKQLAKEAGVRVTWHYNVTTIDPPELMRFIKREHSDVIWKRNPKGPFFHRMIEKAEFPTRRARWCCEEFKEMRSPKGCVTLMGVRSAESPRRAATWEEVCFHRKNKVWMVAPILRWTDADVWGFIRGRGLPYCALYDEGFRRLGCLGCPMSYRRSAELDRWPKYKANWARAFKAIWEKRAGSKQRNGREWFGSARFASWQELWEWWLSNDSLPADSGNCPQQEMWM